MALLKQRHTKPLIFIQTEYIFFFRWIKQWGKYFVHSNWWFARMNQYYFFFFIFCLILFSEYKIIYLFIWDTRRNMMRQKCQLCRWKIRKCFQRRRWQQRLMPMPFFNGDKINFGHTQLTKKIFNISIEIAFCIKQSTFNMSHGLCLPYENSIDKCL